MSLTKYIVHQQLHPHLHNCNKIILKAYVTYYYQFSEGYLQKVSIKVVLSDGDIPIYKHFEMILV